MLHIRPVLTNLWPLRQTTIGHTSTYSIRGCYPTLFIAQWAFVANLSEIYNGSQNLRGLKVDKNWQISPNITGWLISGNFNVENFPICSVQFTFPFAGSLTRVEITLPANFRFFRPWYAVVRHLKVTVCNNLADFQLQTVTLRCLTTANHGRKSLKLAGNVISTLFNEHAKGEVNWMLKSEKFRRWNWQMWAVR